MPADQLPHLETFAQAAELSSFTAAARSLGLTQAAVSQRVAALEKELGSPLFRRRGGRVELTEAGRRLHEFAQRILDLHRQAREEVSGVSTPVAGELNLAASSVPGERLLPGLLSAFRARYPRIQVRATVTDSQAVFEQLGHGRADLGLVGRRAAEGHWEHRRLSLDTLALIVPAGPAWTGRVRASLDELYDQPLLLREAGSGSRWCLEQALAEAGRSVAELRVAAELGSNEAIKEAVLRGLGVAVLSVHAVHKEVGAGQLCALAVDGLRLDREIFAVWDGRRALPIPARLFLDLIDDQPSP